MSNHPVIQYIEEAKKKGLSKAHIIQKLTDVGWQMHDIVAILLEPTGERPIISVRNLSKFYGTLKALDTISFNIREGTITAILGPNGAGKTTLIKILTTLLIPDFGEVIVAGLNITQDAQKLRSIIGLAGQYAAVDEVLSGLENLEMFGRLYHLPHRRATVRAKELLKEFDLEDAGDRSVRTYSGGMRRRLDLASSLIIRPRILFLDEPTAGLDPRSRFGLWRIIRDLVSGGTTVLLTTQYLEEADQLADHIFVIDRGRIIAQGTADELKRQAGGNILELHLAHRPDVEKAALLLKPFGHGEPVVDPNTGIITMPVHDGVSILPTVIRELDAAELKLSDITLRRPSLDDVFLTLTGHGAE